MKTTTCALALATALGAAACTVPSAGPGAGADAPADSTTSTGAGGGTPTPGCSSGTYAGDLGGAPATARVSLEILSEVTYVAGDIRSAVAYYTFQGEAYGDRGWVDVVDHGTNERFRAQVDALADGFLFTANAYEGASSTVYEFHCAR
jgi:hypothetical protein